ncbi:adenine deaminase [candidate division KSB1 bacterium]|nr:adenine deaminase [candidate division KSB1 bacterium]
MIEKQIKAARGEIPNDLVLRNAQIINVYNGQIQQGDIAILQDTIVGIGNGYKGEEETDLKGLYVCPGFIDAHVHIESSMVEVAQFARAVVPLGTTTVVTDPHEIANVLGYEGIRYMMDSSKYNPLNVYFMLSSCVPSSPFETAGSELRAFDLFPFLPEKWVLGLAEMMNYPGLLAAEPEVLDKIKIVKDKRIDGHAPGLLGKDLNAYIAAGVESDHECTTAQEAAEKLKMGMVIMIREGSGTKNLKDLLPVVTLENERRCMFCTDDRHPNDILEEGHIDYVVRSAISMGLNPITAIRMATLNPAEYFGLRKLGAIGPGKRADLVVFDDLHTLDIKRVYHNGELVAVDRIPVYETPVRPSTSLRSSVNIKWLEGDEFIIPARGRQCRVIKAIPDQIVTDVLHVDCPVDNGNVYSDTERDLVRLYVVERHRATGNIGKGLVNGFKLKHGAIATSMGHDSHNIIALGIGDRDIFKAVTAINKMGGGIAIAREGQVIESLELPIAGLMSNKPLEYVSTRMKELLVAIQSLGVELDDPLMTLSFMALPVIPRLKLTDKGLVDVEAFRHVDLFLQ